MNEYLIHWTALRAGIENDIETWAGLAAVYGGSQTGIKYAGKAEAARQILTSMDTLEGLAAHTAAACDTIAQASR